MFFAKIKHQNCYGQLDAELHEVLHNPVEQHIEGLCFQRRQAFVDIGDGFGGVGGLGRGGNIQQNRRKGHKQSVRKRTGEYGVMV